MKLILPKTTALIISILLLSYCKGQERITGTSSTGPLQEIALFRQKIISAIKDNDQVLLKQLYDSSKNIRYEKNQLFWPYEQSLLAMLMNDFRFLANAKWDINDVAYLKTTKKNKTKYFPKAYPKRDELLVQEKKILVTKNPEITSAIAASGNLSAEEKDFVNAEAALLFAYSSVDKKEPLKVLDERLMLYKKKYPIPKYKTEIKYLRRFALTYKRDIFFGAGFSAAKFNNGIQNLFTTPVNYQVNFDFYTKRIGWYVNYNITAWGFKNKVDTTYNDKQWPLGTKNFVSDFQGGFGCVAIKTNYGRVILKTGIGSFSMQPQKGDNHGAGKINLKRFPVFSLGGCVDIANFKLKFIDKKNKTPLGIRLFYQYNFLDFKNKYPQFPTDIQNYGIQVGLML